jgi:hypothetical protein
MLSSFKGLVYVYIFICIYVYIYKDIYEEFDTILLTSIEVAENLY